MKTSKTKKGLFHHPNPPENMKTVCATLKSQCSIVIFAKVAKNWLEFSFLAIILVLDKENPKLLDFLDPYTCPDLGHEEKNSPTDRFCHLKSLCENLELK